MTFFQRLLGSRLVTGTRMFLGRALPPPAGRLLARLVAGAINLLKPGVYWTVHANLRQVVGPETGERELHRLVRSVFCHNARNLYDLWHTASQGVDAIRASVTIPPDSLEQAQRRGKGVIVVGTHTGNFDLAILAMAARCREVQILGLATALGGGVDLMDDFRQQTGAHLTSIDARALREAIERLRSGGIVLTGVDRPIGDGEAAVEFFGRPGCRPGTCGWRSRPARRSPSPAPTPPGWTGAPL